MGRGGGRRSGEEVERLESNFGMEYSFFFRHLVMNQVVGRGEEGKEEGNWG